MVFSSYSFILGFLPFVLIAVYLVRKISSSLVVPCLIFASLIFYAYFDWRLSWVILFSAIVNYIISRYIPHPSKLQSRLTMWLGITFNLCLLGYFKYAGFILENVNNIIDLEMSIQNIVLPLGISFFTFQQIAYLVDVYHSETEEHRFDHYLLFVTFFPQLIAGPIVHHKEMMPQLVHALAQRITINKIALGVAIFSVGLFKKVMIADRVALYATPVFDASASGIPVPFIESWLGVIAYTFQIYFDFSAYSEMAIGLGLLFGLKLPINFLSPYKATSLIDFWRRWHITLSRFLRDYLYIPLGGGHNGERSRYINLLSVMILGGLWHGAAWNFVIWGSLHGVGLAINHGWRQLITPNQKTPVRAQTVKLLLSWLITFLFVTVTWVFFRASNFESAIILLKGMAGFNGFVLPDTYFSMLGPLTEILIFFGVQFEKAPLFLGIEQIGWLGVILLITMLLPNIPQWARYETSSQRLDPDSFTLWSWTWFSWQPNIPWAIGLSAISLLSLVYMADAGEFLYFQF